MPRRIIIDTDPGIDDALAIFFALRHPGLRVEALTTVSGNVHVEKCNKNALYIRQAAGRPDLPVAGGCAAPLARPLQDAEYVHGTDGFGGLSQPAPGPLDSRHAVQAILDITRQHPGEVALVPIGPLTNIAAALAIDPTLPERVQEVILMGGAVWERGNVSATAEFNIWVDPEAAERVFAAPWQQITMVGLDVTLHCNLYTEDAARLRAAGTPLARLCGDLVHWDIDHRKSDRTPAHDPLALALTVAPDLCEAEVLPVTVETQGRYTRGMTVGDRRPRRSPYDTEPVRPVRVCRRVDEARFRRLFVETITA